MTSTMHTEGPLRVGLVGQQAWASATELITGPELPHVDEDLRDDWAAAGIETPAGLDPQWGIALELTRTAKIALQLVSQYADVVFESSLLVGNQDCVAITQRCKVEDGPDGPEVVGAHPMIEVALAPTAQIWSLIRRVLPPLDDARATPIRPGARDMSPSLLCSRMSRIPYETILRPCFAGFLICRIFPTMLLSLIHISEPTRRS